jgi:hypothetical protein
VVTAHSRTISAVRAWWVTTTVWNPRVALARSASSFRVEAVPEVVDEEHGRAFQALLGAQVAGALGYQPPDFRGEIGQPVRHGAQAGMPAAIVPAFACTQMPGSAPGGPGVTAREPGPRPICARGEPITASIAG